jgi:hypothetical protein
MRYRIEFLTETARESSVCYSRTLRTSDLKLAQLQALAWSGKAAMEYGAGGFQIRDLAAKGRIVVLEALDGQPPSIH